MPPFYLCNCTLSPPAAAGLISTESYQCDPTTCQPPACMCPSNRPPGGLTSAEIPQFILVSTRLLS